MVMRYRALHGDGVRTSGRSEASMRVVIQQPQSFRKDVIVLGLLVLFGLVTVALLLLPGLAA